MALLDRLKVATKPTNTIEVQEPEADRRVEPRVTQFPASNPAPQTPPTANSGQAKKPAYTSEPEAISKTYFVEEKGNERRYFDDYQRKALAIRADDTTINSKREDLNTIRAMLTIAEARGWSEVKVSGSAEFKRETWIEAQARGVNAQGYKASDLDRQEADRRRAERGQNTPSQGQATNEVRQASTPSQQPAAQAPQAERVTVNPQPEATRAAEPLHSAKVSPSPAAATSEPQKEAASSLAASRQKLKEATAEISPDGRLILSALSEKIDRQMNKLNAEGKAEMKAYVAVALVRKEAAEGPVVLSAEQRSIAAAPAKEAQTSLVTAPAPALAPAPAPARALDEEAPRLSRGR